MEETFEVIIARANKTSTNPHRAPEQNPLLFECYVMEEMNVITLSASRQSDVNIEIFNLTNGQTVQENTILGAIPGVFSLTGRGQYQITITLASGQVYEGEFVL